jgi:HK97 family phage portal protein
MRIWPWSRKANEDGSVRQSVDLFRLLGGWGSTKSGASVSNATALEVTAVLAAVRVIAEGIAQVPFKLFREVGDKRLPASDHPLYRVLHRKPNGWMSSYDLRETMAIHAALTGNAVAYVGRLRGQVREIIPIPPERLTIKQDGQYRLTYRVTAIDGTTQDLPSSAVWHWRGPSWDGVCGLQVVKLAREAIGLAMAAEDTQASMQKNGALVPGTYSLEGTLNDAQYKQVSDFLRTFAPGGKNAGSPMILDRGAKYNRTGQTGQEAQQLESRSFQIAEIARAFRVMPIMVGYSDKAVTYASAEQMFLAHVVHTLGPWYARIEQSADCQLLTDQELDGGLYTKFVPAGLLRGAATDRSNYFSKALGAGGSPAWMTQDEVRALDELNPMGGAASELPIATNVPKQPEPEPDLTPDPKPEPEPTGK